MIDCEAAIIGLEQHISNTLQLREEAGHYAVNWNGLAFNIDVLLKLYALRDGK